jgi:hypothetical protein
MGNSHLEALEKGLGSSEKGLSSDLQRTRCKNATGTPDELETGLNSL